MKILKSLVLSIILGGVLGLASSAFAQPQCPGVGNDCSQSTTNQGGAGGNAAAAATGGNASASATGGTHIQTNTQLNNQTSINTNTQGQQQGQGQGQYQGQSYQGEQTTNVKVEGTTFDRYAPPVGAPALTSAGTGVCLGSVSIGLSGPMAGASFGITKVDKGCEQRSSAALLYQFGYKAAAVRLLMKNDDVREAMGTDAPAAAKTAAVVLPVSEPVTVSSAQLFNESAPVIPAASVQSN